MFSLVINVLLTGEDTGAKEECYMYMLQTVLTLLT